MSRFLRVFAYIFCLFFIGNAFAANYVCEELYSSCYKGYYLSGTSCIACPGGSTSDNGATSPTQCYWDIELNKNGFSGDVAAGSGTGCTVLADSSDTNAVTLRVYYNTQCILPSFAGAQTNYVAATGWSLSGEVDAEQLEKFTATETPDAIYAQKTMCVAGAYLEDGVCTACPSTYKYSVQNLGDKSECYIKCAAGTYVNIPGGSCTIGSGRMLTTTHNVHYGDVSPLYMPAYPFYSTTLPNNTSGQHNMNTVLNGDMSNIGYYTGVTKSGYRFGGNVTASYNGGFLVDMIRIYNNSNDNTSLALDNITLVAKDTPIDNDLASRYNGIFNPSSGPELQYVAAESSVDITDPENAIDRTHDTITNFRSGRYVAYGLSQPIEASFIQIEFAKYTGTSTSVYMSLDVQVRSVADGNWYKITSDQSGDTSSAGTITGYNKIQATSGRVTRIYPVAIWTPCEKSRYRTSATTAIKWNAAAASDGQTRCPLCSSLDAAYTSTDDIGSTSAEQCYSMTQAGKYIATAKAGYETCPAGSYCAGGTKVYYGQTGGSETCPENSYCESGSASPKSCSTLGGGLYKYTDGASKGSANDCFADRIKDTSTSLGYYFVSANSDEWSPCPAGLYCPDDKIYWENIPSAENCPDPSTHFKKEYLAPEEYSSLYPLNPDGDRQSDRLEYVSSTFAANNASDPSYCSIDMVVENDAGRIAIDSSAYYDVDKAAYIPLISISMSYYVSVNPGYFLYGKDSAHNSCDTETNDGARLQYQYAKACPADSYCPGHATLPLCYGHEYPSEYGKIGCQDETDDYLYSAPYSTSVNDCYLNTYKGSYVEIPRVSQKSCSAGYYCPGGVQIHYGETGGNIICSVGYYCPQYSKNETKCPDGYGYTVSKSDAANEIIERTPDQASIEGAISESQCYARMDDGQWVETPNALPTECPAGWYCRATADNVTRFIRYGATGGREICPSGSFCPAGATSPTLCTSLGGGLYKYTDRLEDGVRVETGAKADTYCYASTFRDGLPDSDGLTVVGGYYIADNQATEWTPCPAGTYCESGNLKWPRTSQPTECPDLNEYFNANIIPADWLVPTKFPDSDTLYDQVNTSKTLVAGSAQFVAKDRLSGIASCAINVVLENIAGQMAVENIAFSGWDDELGDTLDDPGYILTSDNMESAYYLQVNPSFALNRPLNADACKSSTTEPIKYHNAYWCKSLGYCPGITADNMPKCDGSSAADTAGWHSCKTETTYYESSESGQSSINGCFLQTLDGKYLATQYGPADAICEAGYYCPSTRVYYGNAAGTGLQECDSIYKNGGTGLEARGQCKAYVLGGHYIAKPYDDKTTLCPEGSYCPGTLVEYGDAGDWGGRQYCPEKYRDGGAGLSKEEQCQITIPAGKYLKEAYSTTGDTCPAGSYCPETNVNYGQTNSPKPCDPGYDDGGTGLGDMYECAMDIPAGYRLNSGCDNIISQCPEGRYCPATTIKLCEEFYGKECPEDYRDGGFGAAAVTDCVMNVPAGYYMENRYGTDVKECTLGHYCPATSVNYGSSVSAKKCPDDTYADTRGSSECTSCMTGYGTFGELGKTSASDCAIECGGGYYVANKNDSSCSPVGAGYWSQIHSVSQNEVDQSRQQCPVGLTTCGYGSCANEAADCGHVLHIGDERQVYLRADKKTTPSLNVKTDKGVFYGSMTTQPIDGGLKVRHDTSVWTVVDDRTPL